MTIQTHYNSDEPVKFIRIEVTLSSIAYNQSWYAGYSMLLIPAYFIAIRIIENGRVRLAVVPDWLFEPTTDPGLIDP